MDRCAVRDRRAQRRGGLRVSTRHTGSSPRSQNLPVWHFSVQYFYPYALHPPPPRPDSLKSSRVGIRSASMMTGRTVSPVGEHGKPIELLGCICTCLRDVFRSPSSAELSSSSVIRGWLAAVRSFGVGRWYCREQGVADVDAQLVLKF